MKIQCACGTKIAFDITPEMAVNPVQCLCRCAERTIRPWSTSSSARSLAFFERAPLPAPPSGYRSPGRWRRREFSGRTLLPRRRPHPMPRPAIRVFNPCAASPLTWLLPVPLGREFCVKHQAGNHPQVCCLRQTDIARIAWRYSAMCVRRFVGTKAETRGQDVLVYALQKSVVEAKRWRKIGMIGGGSAPWQKSLGLVCVVGLPTEGRVCVQIS